MNIVTLLYITQSSMHHQIVSSLLPEEMISHVESSQSARHIIKELKDTFNVVLCDIEVALEAPEVWQQLRVELDKISLPYLLINHSAEQDLRVESLDLCDEPLVSAPLSAKLLSHACERARSLNFLRHEHQQHSDRQQHQENLFANEMATVQDAAILCLAAIARMRDHSTGNHILRTQHYVKALAETLRLHPRFSRELNDPFTIQLFYKSAALHDIGKVGVADHILLKPGRLTDDEYEEIKKHTIFGYQAFVSAEHLLERELGEHAARFLTIGKQVALSHHERWDGKGYPEGLKGNQIPVVARLMAVADVYDAIVSRRPYKMEAEHNQAVQLIKQGRGSHFDPDVVDAFVKLASPFEQISRVLEDRFPSSPDMQLNSLAELEIKH